MPRPGQPKGRFVPRRLGCGCGAVGAVLLLAAFCGLAFWTIPLELSSAAYGYLGSRTGEVGLYCIGLGTDARGRGGLVLGWLKQELNWCPQCPTLIEQQSGQLTFNSCRMRPTLPLLPAFERLWLL